MVPPRAGRSASLRLLEAVSGCPRQARFLPTDTLFITEGGILSLVWESRAGRSHGTVTPPRGTLIFWSQGCAGVHGEVSVLLRFWSRGRDGGERRAPCEGAVEPLPCHRCAPVGTLGGVPSAPPSILTAALREAPRGPKPSSGGTRGECGQCPREAGQCAAWARLRSPAGDPFLPFLS